MVAWFVKNKEVSLALTILVLFCGVMSFSLLKMEIMPDTRFNSIQIECTNYAASPVDMEKSMISPLEAKLSEIPQISKTTSSIFESTGIINAELKPKTNPSEVINSIRDKIDHLQLPSEAEKIKVKQIILKTEVLSIAVYGKSTWEEKLAKAKKIRKDLTASDIVSDIEIIGRKINKISIKLQDDIFARCGLTPSMISSTIHRNFQTLSLGEIDGTSLTVRSEDENINLYGNIPVVFSECGNVLLKDIADISFEEEDNQITRFGGEDAVILKVYGDDAIEISKSTKRYLKEIEGVKTFSDNADLLKSRLNMLGCSLLWSFVVVTVVLWLYIGLKIAVFSSLGVLVSFSGTFIVMALMGVSINMVSLFAFIMVLGIIVDDSIIIGESIRKYSEKGYSSVDSSIFGVKSSIKAVGGATITNLIFFSTLICLSGGTGVLFQSLALVVISVIIISLIEASILMPSHMAHYDIKLGPNPRITRFFLRTTRSYGFLLEKVLKHKYKFVSACFGMFVLSLLLMLSGIVGCGVLDDDSLDAVTMSVKMSAGTDFKVFEEKIKFCEDSLTAVAENKIKHSITTISKAGNGVPLVGTVLAQLKEGASASNVEHKWKEKTGVLEGAYVDFLGSMFGAPDELEFEFLSEEGVAIKKAIKVFREKIERYEGVHYVYDDFFEERDEIRLTLTEYANFMGISLSDIAYQVRSALYGHESFRFIKDGDEIIVSIKVVVDEIGKLPIKVDDEFVQLDLLANLSFEKSPVFISKSSGMKVVKVKVIFDPSESNIKKKIEEEIESFSKDFSEVRIKPSGIFGEQQELKKDINKLMLIGFFCAYVVLVLILKNFIQPSIILYSIPFGLVGALLGHLILGKALCINSFVGFMAVSGIVINDALVLVDAINMEYKKISNLQYSLLKACKSRLRPIFLTTITTCLSVASIFVSPGVSMLRPMGISIIFGLSISMLINVFFIPCMYSIQLQVKSLISKKLVGKEGIWT